MVLKDGSLILEGIGSLAALCTTVSLFPQLWRVWQRKSAQDISFAMFLIFGLGVLSWFVYGWGVHSWPMIVGNGVTLGLAVAILSLKVKYDRAEADRAPGRADSAASSKIAI